MAWTFVPKLQMKWMGFRFLTASQPERMAAHSVYHRKAVVTISIAARTAAQRLPVVPWHDTIPWGSLVILLAYYLASTGSPELVQEVCLKRPRTPTSWGLYKPRAMRYIVNQQYHRFLIQRG